MEENASTGEPHPHQNLISQFSELTSASLQEATLFLESHKFDLDSAVSTFFKTTADHRNPNLNPNVATDDLDSMDSSPSRSRSASPPPSLGLQQVPPAESGTLVQDPTKGNDVEALFNQARQAGAEEGPLDQLQPSSSSRSFDGRGRLLSGETTASAAPQQVEPEVHTHTITFWTNGFTVNDGPLRSLDDPQNASFLENIRKSECPNELRLAKGRAPVHVSHVRKMEEYPVQKHRPAAFAGVDRTLGTTSSSDDTAATTASGPEEENFVSREPIVYGRRVNLEVPVYEGMDGIIPPIMEDENLEIETVSDEYDELVLEEEEKVTEPNLNVSSFSLHQSRYFQPPRKEGEFCVSDLVWGKVRSHPWWPGQIVDPSGASQKAMKYHKKNCFLVAYFGDHSFAWNDSAVLKPFRANFSQIEKQTNLESFKNAVECALDEVTRRVELGLACSCVPQDIYKKIECQVIENGGVRKKACLRHGSDESASVSSFEPDKLVDYVRSLAQFPHEGDKLDLAMAKAQLSSYGHYKGYREPPEFQVYEDMLEDAPREVFEQVKKNDDKFQNNLIETAYPNKDVSLSDVTDEAPESGYGDNVTSKPVSSSYKKRKARVTISNGSVKRPNRRPDKVSTAPISTPKPSFKIGEMIQRVAIQLTGPPLKASKDGQDADIVVGSDVSLQTPENPQKEASIAEMLLQLHLTAQDPMKDHTFLHTIIPFFYDRRSAVFSKSLKKVSTSESSLTGRKRKASTEKDPKEVEVSGSERKASIENNLEEFEVGGSKPKESSTNDPEEYEFVFDDINDSYWTDRIIQNHSEDQLLQDHQNGGLEYQVVAYEQDKPAKKSRRSNKKRFSSNQETVKVKEESEAEKRRRENLATEVVLKFAEGINFPSENNLNKMFRRFGPLMESETEVDKQGGRARVVFKKCCDAEIAHSSAEKFNIFGSVDVNYELNYTPLVSYRPLPLALLQDPMDAS